MIGLIGKKLGMTQVFDPDGNCVPVTVVEAGPCYVTQLKTTQRDQYAAVQLGFQNTPERKLTLPERGHIKKSGVDPLRYLREFRVNEEELQSLELGKKIDVSIFQAGDKVDVIGNSKGRGFTGVMKRHNFAGFKASHGTHEYFRHAGSIGGRSPQHTVKGIKMAGRYGGTRVTIQNLTVMEVRSTQNLILVRGAVPGARNSLLQIQKALKG
jgi:large subunit ribosomal protein L3